MVKGGLNPGSVFVTALAYAIMSQRLHSPSSVWFVGTVLIFHLAYRHTLLCQFLCINLSDSKHLVQKMNPFLPMEASSSDVHSIW